MDFIRNEMRKMKGGMYMEVNDQQGNSPYGIDKNPKPRAEIISAGALAIADIVLKAPDAYKALKELTSDGPEAFQICVVDSLQLDDMQYLLVLEARNNTLHGAYIEDISLEAAQAKEGHPLKDPKIKIMANYPHQRAGINWGDSESTSANEILPVLVPAGNEQQIFIVFPLDSDTWSAHDRYGRAEVKLTRLNQEATDPIYVTFAIRHTT